MHFDGGRNTKNNDILRSSTKKHSSSKQQQTIIEHFFGRTSPKKEKTVQRGPGAGASIQEPGTYQIKDYLRRPTTNKLDAGPAAKGCHNEGQMRRSRASTVLSRRATSAAPAQRKNCRHSSISSRWDHEKTFLYFGDPQTGVH